MDINTLKTLAEFGAVGIAIYLVYTQRQDRKEINKLMCNHMNHNTQALERLCGLIKGLSGVMIGADTLNASANKRNNDMNHRNNDLNNRENDANLRENDANVRRNKREKC